MLKLKLLYFGHLMQRTDSFEKTLMLGKIEGTRRRGRQRVGWLVGITDSIDMSLSNLQWLVMDRKAQCASVHGTAKSRTWLSDWNDLLTECGTFTASSFRIWNSSTGNPSPPPALFVVMLPKALLTLHSRMSGSRWVITPSWLSWSWRSFLNSSVYSCHLFLISSASVRSYHFYPLLSPSLHEMFTWYL